MSHQEPIKKYTSLVSDSTAEPVSSSDIKHQLNLPSTGFEDDSWINASIIAARKLCERRVPGGIAIGNQTWNLVMDKFPSGDDPIEFPLPPLQSITSVTYFDSANSSTTLASSDYSVHTPYTQPGFIVPAFDKTWPDTSNRLDAVTVQFVTGYSSSTTPETIQHAIKMLVSHWYENRESVLVGTTSKEQELAVDALLMANNPGSYA